MYISFDGYNNIKIKGFFPRGRIEYTEDKVLGYDEGIKLVLSYGKVIGTLLVNVDVIIRGIDVGTDLGSLYGSFDGSIYGKLEDLFRAGRFGSTIDKNIGFDEGIKLGLFYGEVIGTVLGNVDGITLVVYFGIDLVSLDIYHFIVLLILNLRGY